jgi:hypothetical protein
MPLLSSPKSFYSRVMKRLPYDQQPKGIRVIGESVPSFPAEFNRQLQAFDPELWITWHKSPLSSKPGRWKIERCVVHQGSFRLNGKPEHSHLCNRVYVWMVQDDEGTPMTLGEHVFTKLREMRQTWEALGGDTPRGVRNALALSDSIDAELEQKREAAREDMIQYNQKDKRLQINKLVNLVEQHDMRPNR